MGISIGNSLQNTSLINNYFGGQQAMGAINPMESLLQDMMGGIGGLTGGSSMPFQGIGPMLGAMPGPRLGHAVENCIGNFIGMQQNPMMQMMQMMMMMMQMMMMMMGGGANPFMSGMMPGMMGGMPGMMGGGVPGMGGGFPGMGGAMPGMGGGLSGMGGGAPGGSRAPVGGTGAEPGGGAVPAGGTGGAQPGGGAPAGPINGQTMGTAKATGYYPDNSAMEGGFYDMRGKKLNTLQDFLSGKAPYVSIALDKNLYKSGKIKYGDTFRIPEMEKKYGKQIIFKAVDTGGAFTNKGFGRVDICTASQKASTEAIVNGNLTLIKV
ncbi:MAG TPA: hypothetical protein PL110_00710 [Candidatus Eremiobacteraeota bacterium]|nr:MAG: hypothetical protein BWY64_00015 [bacterium ADurb.Bin363]HPZ06608.1 hypothetical protein [Candidatus Eremiobacteraeota bacterium]